MNAAGKTTRATTDLEALQDIALACAAFLRAHGARSDTARWPTPNETAAVWELREALRQFDAPRPTLSRG